MEDKKLETKLDSNIYCFIKNNVIFKKEKLNQVPSDSCALLLDNNVTPFFTVNGEKKYLINFIEIGDTYDEINGFKKTLHQASGDTDVSIAEWVKSYYEDRLNDEILKYITQEYSDFQTLLKNKEWKYLITPLLDEIPIVEGIGLISLTQEEFIERKKAVIKQECINTATSKAKEYGYNITEIIVEL